MKEDFVTYDIAVKLKEKGYPQNGFHYYNEKGRIDVPVYNLLEYDMPNTLAPQIHEVLKWLREEKKLFVEPSLFKGGYESYVQSTLFEDDKDYTDVWRVKGFHSTYEQAALAGIEYVIDNLI